MGRKLKITKQNKKVPSNVVFKGDNLEIIKSGIIPPRSIDLVYIDPPFCTQRKQTMKKWSKKISFGSYDDTWGGGISSYQIWLKNRLQSIYNLLKEDGSLFLHLDYNAVHYGKILCDEIFGQGDKNKGRNFLVNEIIWAYIDSAGRKNGNFYKRTHNTILWYSKSKKDKRKKFAIDTMPLAESTEKRYGYLLDKYNGKLTYNQLKKENEGAFKSLKSVPDNLNKTWLSRNKGTTMNDWWNDIKPIKEKGKKSGSKEKQQQAKEPFIYTTQKPIKLLTRIIETATKKGDLVADFFCGCGVALTAADKLGRKWIGVDKSKDAINAIRKHLAFHRKINPEIVETIEIKKSDIVKMSWQKYQDWAVRQIGGQPAIVKNKGCDGFMPDGSWIEVKKWKDAAGIGAYRQVLEGLEETGQAYIIANKFSNELKEKKDQILLSKGWDLHLIPESDLLRDAA